MAKRHEQLAENVGAETPLRAAIRALRQQRDVSQNKMAVLLGVTDTTIARWEMGLHKPTPPQLIVMLLLARPPAQELFENLTGKKKAQLLRDLELRSTDSMFAMEAAEHADSPAFRHIQADGGRPPSDPYDELFSRLRRVIDSGQSQLIGQAEELIFRLADKAQYMTKKREAVRRGKMPKIECYVWTSCDDELTCSECKKMNGQEWKRKKDANPKPPHPSCTSPEGCRCELIGIYDDEGTVTLE